MDQRSGVSPCPIRHYLLLALLPAALPPLACGGGSPGEEERAPGGGCLTDEECPAAEYCQSFSAAQQGLCVPGCRLRPDICPEQSRCDPAAHRCMPIGCRSDGDCIASRWCRKSGGQEEGGCVDGCRLGEGSCPAGEHCVAEGGEQRCRPDVQPGCDVAGCPAGQHCDLVALRCVGCLEQAHCAADELCLEQVCVKACPGGCAAGTECNPATRGCEPAACAEDGSCPAGLLCCPASGRCTPGECPGPECCGGEQACLAQGERFCRESYGDRRCGAENGCVELPCADDGGCPADSWCDDQRAEPVCRRGCREDGCSDGKICDPASRRCINRPCPGGQQDCPCGVEQQSWCNPRSGRCEPGCCGDEVCDRANHEHCDPATHRCVQRACPNGDADCPRAPWPGGTWCRSFENPPICVPGCQIDADCPDGLPCTREHSCGCADDQGCPAGQRCRARRCVPECRTHADCPAGYCSERGRCLAGCPADRFAGNGSRQQPAPLPAASAEWDGLTLCPGEEDWYAVHLAPGDGLAVRLGFDQRRPLAVEVHAATQPVGPALAASDGGGGAGGGDSARVELAGGQVAAEGDYLIRVLTRQPLAAPSFYRLEVDLLLAPRCRKDALEGLLGNEERATAAGIQPRTYRGLDLCSGDVDWYRLQLDAGTLLNVRLSCDVSSRTRLELHDAQARLLQQAESWCFGQVRQQIAVTGVYYLRIGHAAGAEGETVRGYLLQVQTVPGDDPCSTDPMEPNDEQADAYPLADLVIGEAGNVLPGLQLCGAEEDWFEIPARCPLDNLGVRLDFDPVQGDLDLELLDEQGPLATSAGVGRSEEITVRDRPSRRHFLRVHAPGGAQTTYALTVRLTCSPGCADDGFDLEPGNDAASQARPLGLGRLEGALQLCPREEDWYHVEPGDGADLRAQLCFDSARCDLRLEIYDAAGSLLHDPCPDCPGQGGGGSACVLLGGLTEDPYYIRVFSADPQAACAYTLKVAQVADFVQCPPLDEAVCPR